MGDRKFHKGIMEIMKNLEFHWRIKKITKNNRITQENHENH